MKVLKFNESVNEDIYSLIDELSEINTFIEDDLMDFRDRGYSLYTNDDGHIILKGDHNNIYESIQILNKLEKFNINLIDVKLTESKFKYVISNPNRVNTAKKIMDYFSKNLKFTKEDDHVSFHLHKRNEMTIDIDIRDNLSVFMEVSYGFYHSEIYQKSRFRGDDIFDRSPNKDEWISLVELVKDCIDYAKKNNIKI